MYKSGERVHDRQQIKTAAETANCIAKEEPVVGSFDVRHHPIYTLLLLLPLLILLQNWSYYG